MNANLELYRVFCEVVKYQNISKAADNMFISQSAVTQSIQKLENLLGGKLFFRSKSGVELTEEGRNLYEYIKDSIETMSNAENIFSNYTNLEKGKIRISAGNVLLNLLIMPSLIEVMKDYPNIDISISTYTTEEGIQKLTNGEIDIIALNLSHTLKRYSNLDVIKLKSEPNYCFFATKNYLKNNPIGEDLKGLEKHKIIFPNSQNVKARIEEYCKENNIKFHINHEVANAMILKNMVLNDLGIGYSNLENIRDIISNKDVVVIKDIEYENNDDIQCVATLKKNMCSKATIELVKRIKKRFQ